MKKIQNGADGKTDISGVHIWLVLMKAFHAIEHESLGHLRNSKLGDSDFRVLEALLHKGPMPVNVIGPKVFLTPGSISVAVARLFERGLVSRVDSHADRRVRVVDLTPRGRTVITKLYAAHAHRLEELAHVLSGEERVQLINSLKKLGKHAAGHPR